MKNILRSGFRKIGLDIRFVRNNETIQREKRTERSTHWAFLRNYKIRTVFDIGANKGQFAVLIHELFPDAELYCFEPVHDCFLQLKNQLSSIPRSKAIQLALGNRNGYSEIHRSEYTVSSSLLEMTELHKKEWPQSTHQTLQNVNMSRLDDAVSDLNCYPDILIKMDVQGYESEVIKGGSTTLRKTLLAIIEVCFFEFYTGQALFGDIYSLMSELGFAYRGNIQQFSSKIDNRILFADALFENLQLEKK